jgi:hypothetical protein
MKDRLIIKIKLMQMKVGKKRIKNQLSLMKMNSKKDLMMKIHLLMCHQI